MRQDFTGRRVTVMGLGRFGGGVGATRYLARRGAAVTVTDSAKPETLAEGRNQLADLPVRFVLGEHRAPDFTDTDLLVVGPGVPKSSPWLRMARQAGVPFTAEMNLLLAECAGRIVGVTGTNGKSTTTAMIGDVLSRARRCWVGGNIGRSLLEIVEQITPADAVSLEMSSFQLEDLGPARLSPPVAVVTNLTPNHLDRHADMAEYGAAKQQIFLHQSPAGWLVLNHDCPVVSGWAGLRRGKLAWYATHKPSPAVRAAAEVSVWAEWTGRRAVTLHAEFVEGSLPAATLAGVPVLEGLPGDSHVPPLDPTVEDFEADPFAVVGADRGTFGPAAVLRPVADLADRRPRLRLTTRLELRVPGRHNLSNALAAVAVGLVEGVPAAAIVEALAEYRALPDRLEHVADVAGVAWFNDSIATNPESVYAALDSFTCDRVCIVGGANKNLDLGGLADALVAKAKAVVLIGAVAAEVEGLLRDRLARIAASAPAAGPATEAVATGADEGSGRWPAGGAGDDGAVGAGATLRTILRAGSMDEAVAACARIAGPGDVVLMSPACASFDMFTNYRHRGEVFRRAVRALPGAVSAGTSPSTTKASVG